MAHIGTEKERPNVDWLFRGKVKAKKTERHLRDIDLSLMTGIPVGTIRAWACGKRDGDNVADAIACALQIER